MRSAKVCMVGAFGVGKTSLVRRFVHQQFDDRYHTTLGVKIDTKIVDSIEKPIKLVLWDMEGADPFETDKRSLSRIQSYLKGAHGLILVADGTRPATVETALGLYHDFCRHFHDVPAVLMANKADLTNEWRFDKSILPDALVRLETSALNDQNVEAAFTAIGEMLSKL
ncbi:MAG: GTP-binding protein [Xanthomonadales bacterium]|nr:GTP-binding protein [Gammaproteobacteria bacterium]NNK03279.1 GTP-binding protein [Xanthomonadales bacterium]